ncbi:MAG: tetratricopeptide repeat protein, partial [Paracoccaceae bacterium]
MKATSIFAALLALALVFDTGALAQDFDRGKAAFEAGDYAAALTEWRPLAEKGDAWAQNGLGVLYANGFGVAQDFAQALEWYRKAAAQGHARAQTSIGFMYAEGQGVAQDFAQALEWYRKAAA